MPAPLPEATIQHGPIHHCIGPVRIIQTRLAGLIRYDVSVGDDKTRYEAATVQSQYGLTMLEVIYQAIDRVFLWIPAIMDPHNQVMEHREVVLDILRKTVSDLSGVQRRPNPHVMEIKPVELGTLMLTRYYNPLTDQIITTCMYYPTLDGKQDLDSSFYAEGQCQMRMSPAWIDPGPFQ